ncbi:MAG: FecR domain-containing protein [Hyphomicrobiales bacterium]|nr:FecR domain-containing protein [Hyphomicrobiales bacterium]
MSEAEKVGLRPHLLAGAAILALLHSGTAFAATVGTAGAANTRSTGTPPGSAMRVIEIGTQVVTDEKIETSASGSVQLLFIDKTTLNIGPNSSLIIDKFVFDPATAQGELAISLSKGVLRVVGGQATHTGGATITTPVAALGLRGGIVSAKHSKAEGTQAILGFGALTMTSGGETQTVTRPGFIVKAVSANSPPSTPTKATSAEINEANGAVTSKGNQAGGSSVRPTDQQAADYNVGTAISAAPPLQIGGQVLTSTNLNAINGTADAIAQQGAQVPLSTQASVVPSPPPPPAPQPQAFALMTTAGAGSGVPFLTASFAGNGNFNVSPVLGFAAGGTNANGTPNTSSRLLQASLSVNGQGPAQTSTISVMTALFTNDPTLGPTLTGGVDASTRKAANQIAFHLDSAVSSVPGTAHVDANGLPIGSFGTNQNQAVINPPASKIIPSQGFTNLGGTPQNFTFNQTVNRLPTPAGLGADHPNALLTAFVGGIMQTLTFSPAGAARPVAVSAPFAINGTGQIFLDGSSSKLGAEFDVAAVNPNSTTPQLTSANFKFGSVTPNDPNNTAGLGTARGTFIDRTDFGARAQAVMNGDASIETSSITDTSGRTFQNSPGNTSTSLSSTGLLMVTANTVGANTSTFLTSISTAPSVTPCQCEFTQWGFWSASATRTDRVNNVSFLDTGNLMLWVAGIPAKATDIPTTGAATYTGHAIANISNNGAQYIAAGTFTNQVNFAQRTGLVQIAGLDTSSYGGVVNLAQGSPNLFSGVLNTGPSNRFLTLSGQFFQGGPTNTTPLFGEMGGNFSITGPNNYLGSGIFAARKP